MEYEILPARNSSSTLLIPKFVVVDFDLIGTHEISNNMHDNQTLDVIKSIKKSGYIGPAISVFEAGNDSLYEYIEPNTFVKVDLGYGKIGVADGHNRLSALKEMYESKLISTKLIPVQLIPARNSKVIRIQVDNPNEKVWTIEEIESCFSDSERVMNDSENTSHFEVAFKDGIWRRIRDAQPDIKIDL